MLEPRFITIGRLRGRMVVVAWTPRRAAYRIISMRKANDREQAPTAPSLRTTIPDLSTPEWKARFDAAPVRRGRPPMARPKVSTTIRLDADVLEKFRATGPGWQSRINAVLKAAKL